MTETPITKCPPGYAIGYVPYASARDVSDLFDEVLSVAIAGADARDSGYLARNEKAREQSRKLRTPWVKWEARWS